ncbi:hypothetical protein CBL_00413 [Carabus blaptoides fortunei]
MAGTCLQVLRRSHMNVLNVTSCSTLHVVRCVQAKSVKISVLCMTRGKAPLLPSEHPGCYYVCMYMYAYLCIRETTDNNRQLPSDSAYKSVHPNTKLRMERAKIGTIAQ